MADSVPVWLERMRELDGTKWAPGDGKNLTILEWLRVISETYPDMASYCAAAMSEDYFSWCGLTVGFCMTKAGIAPVFGPTDTGRFLFATAWLGWGTPVATPQLGDVVVFDFGGGDHHVTLFEKDNGDGTWSCHGGNQSHAAMLTNFRKSSVMGVRHPIVRPAALPGPVALQDQPVAVAKPASQRLADCVALVLHDEGGNDDDPRDPGGRTSRGITQEDWNRWLQTHSGLPTDVFQAPQDQIVAIYQEKYWNTLSCDSLPSGIDYSVFDYGVLSGVGRAAKVLQGFVGADVDGEIGPQTITATLRANTPDLINRICDERLAFLRGLGTFATFGKGWTARVERVRRQSLAMASAAPRVAPPVVIPIQPQVGTTPMTPDETAQAIVKIITAVAAQQAGTGNAPANMILQILTSVLAAQQQGAAGQPAVPSQDVLQAILATLLKQQPPGTASTGSTPIAATDPISMVERLLSIVQKGTPAAATTTPVAGSSPVDQLKPVADLLNAILGKTGTPALGQVNSALGDTIGNLLNGKKTAIGIGGSLLTTLLSHVTTDPSAGGLGGLLGTVAMAVPGLSQFTLPIFLATTVWGVLGKMEKWSQGTAPPPKPQS